MSNSPHFDNSFSEAIYRQKYAQEGEEWPDTVARVAFHVLDSVGLADTDEHRRLQILMEHKQFIPGGRYLYGAGRDLHQCQNCALYRAEDTREGWADLTQKVTMALMTGAGVGVWYGDVRPSDSIISRTGGVASGPISLMKIVNEVGRNVMQGGARRSAVWAGLPWWHADIFDFIRAKDWSPEVRALKEEDFTFPAALDMTNISVTLDDAFFDAYEGNGRFAAPGRDDAPDGRAWRTWAHAVYDLVISKMLTTAEPGFSVDTGENAGEVLRNAPVCGGTNVLTDSGYEQVVDMLGQPRTVWTGNRWASGVVFRRTQSSAPVLKVAMTGGRTIRCEPSHEFLVERYLGAGIRRRLDAIVRVPANQLRVGDICRVSMPTAERADLIEDDHALGLIYGDGSFTKAGGADLTLCSPESKACAASLSGASSDKHDSRGHSRMYFGVDPHWDGRSKAEFPSEFLNDHARIASFVAGVFDADGDYEPTQRRIRLSSKHPSFLHGVRRALEQLGIVGHVSKAGNTTYGKSQHWQLVVASSYSAVFAALIPTQRLDFNLEDGPYRDSTVKIKAVEPDGFEDVFCADVMAAEHSFMAEGVIISNCTEIVSADDSDICNLGSLNMGRFDTKEQFAAAVKDATLFLLAGTVYSDLPHDEVYATREKNRRLGLGLMGVHEWLLKRGKIYGADEELAEWLEEYARSTGYAQAWADSLGLSRPVKTRAIAPNGTIGILAETTTSAEPIFAAAYKRRVRHSTARGDRTVFEYVVDPTAARLVAQGVDPHLIEDAYTLSYDVERRVAFQAWLQRYVDHGISSTVNLPGVISDPEEQREFGAMLLRYLPKLRGITAYPDGSRGGQPLTSVPLEYALDKTGVVYEEAEERCLGGQCGV